MKTEMYWDDDLLSYVSEEGLVMRREHGGETPNGNPFNGRWVLRNALGEVLDFSTYRNDIAEGNNLWLSGTGI